MDLFKNRKSSGMVLTGAFAVPAAMSLAQQGVVSANPVVRSVDKAVAQSLLGKIWENKWGKAGVLTFGVLLLIAVFFLVQSVKREYRVLKSMTVDERYFCEFIDRKIMTNKDNEEKVRFIFYDKNEKITKRTLDLKMCKLQLAHSKELFYSLLKCKEEQKKECEIDFTRIFAEVAFRDIVKDGNSCLCAYIDDSNTVFVFDKRCKKKIKEKIEKGENFKDLRMANNLGD